MATPRALALVLLAGFPSAAQSFQGSPFPDSSRADQSLTAVRLTQEVLDEFGSLELWHFKWRYHSGDDPLWARPEFDDRAWKLVSPELREHQFSRLAPFQENRIILILTKLGYPD